MNSKKSLQTYFLAAIIVFGFIAVFGLSNFLENNRPSLPESYIDEDLSMLGEHLEGYALGFEGLIADWYWMSSLQYIGDKIFNNDDKDLNLEDLRPLNPKLLYPLLDNATTLDPKFLTIYSYGAIVLPAIDPKQAIKITEKGIENNPGEWRLYQHLGYIHWRLKNYEKAAEVYENGSKIAGAPSWMKSMSAKMHNDGGARQTAREIYSQMFEKANDTRTKENAMVRLLQLDSLDETDAIGDALQNFKKQNRRCVRNWNELFPLLQAEKLPGGKDFRINKDGEIVDPTDAPYLLDRGECKVKLDFEKTKIPR